MLAVVLPDEQDEACAEDIAIRARTVTVRAGWFVFGELVLVSLSWYDLCFGLLFTRKKLIGFL